MFCVRPIEMEQETPPFQREFDALHQIPMYYMCFSIGIQCTTSTSRVLYWNSMQCIELQLKDPSFHLEFHALHRIPDERPFLSTRIRCTASNSRILYGISMQCIDIQIMQIQGIIILFTKINKLTRIIKKHIQGIFKESYKSDKNKYLWGFLPLFIFAGFVAGKSHASFFSIDPFNSGGIHQSEDVPNSERLDSSSDGVYVNKPIHFRRIPWQVSVKR